MKFNFDRYVLCFTATNDLTRDRRSSFMFIIQDLFVKLLLHVSNRELSFVTNITDRNELDSF